MDSKVSDNENEKKISRVGANIDVGREYNGE